jgi:integrase
LPRPAGHPKISPLDARKNYSYSHIVNTSLALEHYAKFKGIEVTLGRPRKPRRIVQNVLSESEVSRLIQAARNPREKAIIALLAYSGVRNSELRNIRRKDIDLGANHLKILGGKNKKTGLRISPPSAPGC